ncbi:hypothetical protein SNEBB_009760 [Seison nebaliae]|nr:hypothetical protein SNEBB_009760 [Seison nebaliae]
MPNRQKGHHIDSLTRKTMSEVIRSIDEPIHFSTTEMETLLLLFIQLTKNSKDGKLDRSKFCDFLHNTFDLTDAMLIDRVHHAFDRDNDSSLCMKEWLTGLSVFVRGKRSEKIKFCFNVYDENGDSFISRDEMFKMLKNSVIKQPSEEDPEESTKELVEIALKKMDKDHDGRVSLTDFQQSVQEEPLLLECFGKCLPNRKRMEQFNLIFEDVSKYDELLLMNRNTK